MLGLLKLGWREKFNTMYNISLTYVSHIYANPVIAFSQEFALFVYVSVLSNNPRSCISRLNLRKNVKCTFILPYFEPKQKVLCSVISQNAVIYTKYHTTVLVVCETSHDFFRRS